MGRSRTAKAKQPAQDGEIVRLYKSGKSVIAVAAALSLDRGAVARVVWGYGIARPLPNRPATPEITDAHLIEIARLQGEGRSDGEIGAALNIHVERVGFWIARLNLRPRVSLKRGLKVSKIVRETFNPDEIATLRRLTARQATLAEARQQLPGRSDDSIQRCIDRNELPCLYRPSEIARGRLVDGDAPDVTEGDDDSFVAALMAEGGHPSFAVGADGLLQPRLVRADGSTWIHTPKGSPGWPQLRPNGAAFPHEAAA